jgi:hypothetical protein
VSQAQHVLSILVGAAFTVSVMWALGCLLFGALRIELPSIEHELLAALSGGPLLSFLTFLLCVFHAARTPVFLLLGIAALSLNWRYGARALGQLPALPAMWKWFFVVPFVLFAALYLSNSLAPEISPDGATYHLGFVFRYFREHGFHRLTNNMYGSLPQGMEMLFLFAFAFGRHSAAATVHCFYLLALPLLMMSYARRIGRPGAGACAAMLVYLSPVVGIDGVSAYNDVALAATAFAMFYLLGIWRENEQNAFLIPIGLTAGFCFAIKATGVVAMLYAGAFILLHKRPRALLTTAAAAAMIALPWPIKNWLWLGNPASPFLNKLFPNPWIHIQFEEDYSSYTRHYELTSFRQWPWIAAVTGDLSGQLGPLFLLAPIALLAARSREGTNCLIAAFCFMLLYPLNIDVRFLIPALPFLALAMAFAVEGSQTVLALLISAAALLALPPVINFYRGHAGDWHIEQMPWKAVLRIVPQDEFLRTRSAAWISAVTLDYYVPSGKRVWSTTAVAEAYAKTNVMTNYESAEGELIEDILSIAVRPDLAPTLNFQFTFPEKRVQRLRVLQKGMGAGIRESWSIGEVRLFSNSRQIPPAPDWRLNAAPFPWDVGLAFDNNAATRWRSWQTLRPRMHVDVDFETPVDLDRVEIHCSHDQPASDLQLETCDGSSCTAIPARLLKKDDPPASDLRRVAAQTVKERGIDYLLIDEHSWAAADMRKDPARWGLDFIAERAGNRLYRIQ